MDEGPLKRGGRKYKDLDDPVPIILTDADVPKDEALEKRPQESPQQPIQEAPQQPPNEFLKRFLEITGRKTLDAYEHVAGLIIGGLLSIWVVHLLLGVLFGPDEKLFDLVPLRYIIDFAEVAVLAKLIWHIIRGK